MESAATPVMRSMANSSIREAGMMVVGGWDPTSVSMLFDKGGRS